MTANKPNKKEKPAGSKQKFCIKCGKRGISGILCKECKAQQDKEIMVRDISMKVCVGCGKILSQNKWLSKSYENVIDKELNKNTPVTDKLKIIEINMPEINPGQKKETAIIVKKQDNEFIIPINFEGTYCPKCSKKDSQYFEGILQLKKPSDNVIEWLHNDMKKAEKKGVYVTKREEKKGVALYYITDKHYMINIGKRLYNNFGGILKINEQLFSHDRQTSKDIFRINVFFEASPYSKGDVVYFKDKRGEHIINTASIGAKITGTDLMNNKHISFDYKEIENKDNEVNKLEIKEAIISTLYPDITVIHPETYQAMPIQNSGSINKDTLKDKKSIKIVEKENKLWIIT